MIKQDRNPKILLYQHGLYSKIEEDILKDRDSYRNAKSHFEKNPHLIGGYVLLPESIESGNLCNRFIVSITNTSSLIYFAPISPHVDIGVFFGVESWFIRGGGEISIKDKCLKLWAESSFYGTIPNQVAYKFAKILKPELEQRGFEIKDTKIEMEDFFNDPHDNYKYWRDFIEEK